ncbi:MAG: GNAT family N-acetyltransferase [Candidatus Sulfotelmatobacter sp.]
MPNSTSAGVLEVQRSTATGNSIEREELRRCVDAALLAKRRPGVSLTLNYDELVTRSPQGSIFAHRWWLEAVAPRMYEILEIKKGDEIQAAWPIVYHTRDEAKHVVMPALTQKLGILFAPSSANLAETQSKNQKLTTELMEQLGDIASFRQNFHENFADWLPFYWRGYDQTSRYTYALEDISDPTALWNGMRRHHRRDIRRAERLGIRVKDDLDLGQFLELNRKTFTRQGREPLASDELIWRLDRACCANAGRKIFAGVDSRGRVHAAVYVAWADNTAYYLMGGSEPDLRASGAQLLALWEAILFSSSVVKRFDFEGSMLPQVECGFRGFGAKQLPYFSITKVPPLPTSLRAFLSASIEFRWNQARRTIASRFQKQ